LGEGRLRLLDGRVFLAIKVRSCAQIRARTWSSSVVKELYVGDFDGLDDPKLTNKKKIMEPKKNN
jgi:hypothetical protein